MASTGAQTFTVSFSKSSNYVAISTVKNLLEAMTYNNTNANNPTSGARVITVASVQDSGGGTDTYTTSLGNAAQSTVTVSATNDAPVNTVPASVSVGYNSSTYITGLGVSDADAGAATTFSVKLTVTQGTLSLSSLSGVSISGNSTNSVSISGNSTNSVTLTGKVADINAFLSSSNAVQYTAPAGTSGSFTLTMTSNDAGNSGSGAGTDVVTPNSTAKLSTLRIKDTFGAFADSGISTATTNIPVTADSQAPTLRSAVLSSEANNKIILNFDEPLNASVDMTVLKNSFTIAGNSISTASISGSSVILTTSSAVTSGVAVTYADNPGAAAIQDAAGVHATTQTMRADSDASAPTLTGSMVYYNGSGSALNKFVLNFSEDMSSVSAPSQFSVYISDPVYPDRTGTASVISSTVLSGGASSYGNNTVTFGITPGFLSPNASVSVTYTDSTTGNDVSAIQDVAGNDVGNMVLGAWTNDILSASQSAFTAGKTVLVVGGQGNDTMTGGLANDTFTWFAGDAGATGAVDVVKSFVPFAGGGGDKLDISKLLTGYAGGTNLSQWVTSVTTAQTSPAGVTGSTKIVIDTDGLGSTGAIQTIWLEGVNLTLSGATLEAQLAALKTSGVLIA